NLGGAKASAEQVPAVTVSAIETQRMQAIHPLHAGRKVAARRFHEKVVVRCHETERAADEVAFRVGVGEEVEEVRTVEVVEEDRLRADAMRGHVVETRWERLSRYTRHAATVRPPRRGCPTPRRIVTNLSQISTRCLSRDRHRGSVG